MSGTARGSSPRNGSTSSALLHRPPAETGNFYGGQWWLVPDDRNDVPSDAYSTAGNRGQYTVVVPSHNMVIVRRGLDYGRQGFNRWDLTREVLKAVESVSEDGAASPR